jgi:hypothetical protein
MRRGRRLHFGAGGKADFVQQLPRGRAQRLFLARRAPETEARARARLHGQHHVLERRKIRVDAGDLKGARQPLARTLRSGERGDVLAGEADRAGVGTQLARELGDERRFSGTVRSDDGMRFALPHLQIDAVARAQRAEALRESSDFEQGPIHFSERTNPPGRA